jgi:hypothetical protein
MLERKTGENHNILLSMHLFLPFFDEITNVCHTPLVFSAPVEYNPVILNLMGAYTMTRALRAMLISIALLFSLTGCATQPSEETTLPAQTREEITYRQAAPGCVLQVTDKNREPFYNFRISIKSLSFFDENTEQLTDILSESDSCTLPTEEGLYHITVTNLSDESQTITFPIQIRKGAEDTFSVATDFSIPKEIIPEESTGVVYRGSGEADYEEVQWDRSDSTLNEHNHWNAHVRCNYPVLSGVETADRINAEIYSLAEAFMNVYTDEQIRQSHYAYGMAMAYEHISNLDVTHNDDGIFSFRFRYNTFWGESCEYSGARGYTYSLETGEKLTLSQLLGVSQQEAMRLAKKRVDEYMSSVHTADYTREVTDEDIGFYVSDGKIYLTIEIPVANIGRSGAMCLETPWSISQES